MSSDGCWPRCALSAHPIRNGTGHSAGLPINGSERAIWFDLVTTPGMPLAWQFYAEFESWLWTDEVVLAHARERIRPAVEIWDRLDDRGVYGSPLLDKLRQIAL